MLFLFVNCNSSTVLAEKTLFTLKLLTFGNGTTIANREFGGKDASNLGHDVDWDGKKWTLIFHTVLR